MTFSFFIFVFLRQSNNQNYRDDSGFLLILDIFSLARREFRKLHTALFEWGKLLHTYYYSTLIETFPCNHFTPRRLYKCSYHSTCLSPHQKWCFLVHTMYLVGAEIWLSRLKQKMISELRARICQIVEITRTIYSNSESSVQFL